MARRGATMVEVTLSVLLTAIVLGGLTTVYTFTVNRAGHAAANTACATQARQLLDEIEAVVSLAQRCEYNPGAGIPGLRCIMPATGQDTDSDGYMDSFQPKSVSPQGSEQWGRGDRYTFYMGLSTGAYNPSGTYVWRAKRADNVFPGAADADPKWAMRFGSNNRWHLITGLSFSVDNSKDKVTVTVTASSQSRADVAKKAADADSISDSVTITRVMTYNNWRK